MSDPGAAGPGSPSATGLGWRVLRSSASLGIGRILIALVRLVGVGLIVQLAGKSVFGEYALVVSLLMLAEWIADFGTTETFVREICREPERRLEHLRTLTATKLVQVPVAFAALAIVLVALRYPSRVVEAGLVAGTGLLFYGGVLVYRVLFRVDLTMEREVGAEVLSVVAMLPLLLVALKAEAGVVALVACHAASRGFFLAFCLLLGRKSFRLGVSGATRAGVRQALHAASAIGASGLVVVLYDTLDVLLLGRFGTLADVGLFSGAQRLVWPILAVLMGIGTTLYPIMAGHWPHSRSELAETCQRGLEAVCLLAGFAVTAVLSGPHFFLRLLGPDLVEATPALEALVLLVVAKGVSQTVGPVLYLVFRQWYLLQLVASAVLLKATLIVLLAPHFGFRGVAYAALGLEVLFLGRTLVLVRRFTGYTPRLATPAKAAAAAALSVLVARFLFPGLGLLGALAAPVLYGLVILGARVVRVSDLRALLPRSA